MTTDQPWEHPRRPPIGQYRLTVVVTGDDLGPDMLCWLVENRLSQPGHTASVETVDRIGGER